MTACVFKLMKRFGCLFSFLCLGCFLSTVNPSLSFSEEIRYQSGERRDPFVAIDRAASTAVNSETGMKIEGILFDPSGKSMVVIGGETYKVGDLVGDQKIIAIQSNKIIAMSKKGETHYWISSEEQKLAESSGK